MEIIFNVQEFINSNKTLENKQTHLMFGFIAGMASVVIYLAIYLAGVMFKPGMQYVPYIPMLVGVVWNAIAFSKANGGAVTFANVFGSGFRVSMIVILISLAWFVISVYIFPEMKTKALQNIHDSLTKTNQMNDKEIEKSMEWMQKGYVTMLVSSTVFTGLLIGVISALIGGAVARKNQIEVDRF